MRAIAAWTLALGSLHFSDIDVKVSDQMIVEGALRGFAASELGQSADAMMLDAAM